MLGLPVRAGQAGGHRFETGCPFKVKDKVKVIRPEAWIKHTLPGCRYQACGCDTRPPSLDEPFPPRLVLLILLFV